MAADWMPDLPDGYRWVLNGSWSREGYHCLRLKRRVLGVWKQVDSRDVLILGGRSDRDTLRDLAMSMVLDAFTPREPKRPTAREEAAKALMGEVNG